MEVYEVKLVEGSVELVICDSSYINDSVKKKKVHLLYILFDPLSESYFWGGISFLGGCTSANVLQT